MSIIGLLVFIICLVIVGAIIWAIVREVAVLLKMEPGAIIIIKICLLLIALVLLLGVLFGGITLPMKIFTIN